MTNRKPMAILWACVAMTLLVGGCKFQAAPAPIKSSGVSIDPIELDPCAERLHDICGQLLLYYAVNKDLPRTLGDLRRSHFSETILNLACPVSHEPYIYNREGLPVPDREGKIIVFDTKPCHAGMRWGILLEPAKPGQPLVLRILRAPEAAIQWNGPPK